MLILILDCIIDIGMCSNIVVLKIEHLPYDYDGDAAIMMMLLEQWLFLASVDHVDGCRCCKLFAMVT